MTDTVTTHGMKPRPGSWWRGDPNANILVPWPEQMVMPMTSSGYWDYDEISCMREAVWAVREGLA